MSIDAITVFFSYSHKDEELRDELAKQLRTLERNGVISGWHDRKILPGDEWDRQIKDNLNSAQIILLLVSADFIDSDYCHDVEIARAMERHKADEARVIPVILRPCLWNITPLGELQALPKNAAPVTDTRIWPNQDAAFFDIAKGICDAVSSFTQQISTTKETASPPAQRIANNAPAQYRERVQEYLVNRRLTRLQKIRLEQLSRQLGLSAAEAQQILAEELAPIALARETYREALSKL